MLKKLGLLLVFIIIVLIPVACGSSQPQPEVSSIFPSNDIDLKISENWEYIVFDKIYGWPSSNLELISKTIAQWEQDHPDREIISLQIIYKGRSYASSSSVDGISIYSKIVP